MGMEIFYDQVSLFRENDAKQIEIVRLSVCSCFVFLSFSMYPPANQTRIQTIIFVHHSTNV